jgi:hypothetical protein
MPCPLYFGDKYATEMTLAIVGGTGRDLRWEVWAKPLHVCPLTVTLTIDVRRPVAPMKTDVADCAPYQISLCALDMKATRRMSGESVRRSHDDVARLAHLKVLRRGRSHRRSLKTNW